MTNAIFTQPDSVAWKSTIGKSHKQKNMFTPSVESTESCRDLGFNTILTFFSKLSAGTGEQLLTRQVLRLGHELDLPEFLTFYYAHAGWKSVLVVLMLQVVTTVVQVVVERSDKNRLKTFEGCLSGAGGARWCQVVLGGARWCCIRVWGPVNTRNINFFKGKGILYMFFPESACEGFFVKKQPL